MVYTSETHYLYLKDRLN